MNPRTPNVTAVEMLRNLGVPEERLRAIEWRVENQSQWGGLIQAMGTFLPLLLFGGLLLLMLRQAQGSNNQARDGRLRHGHQRDRDCGHQPA